MAWRNLFAGFDAALRLLHPFMPFLTEELWHQLPQRAGAKSIALDSYPEALASWNDPEAIKEYGLVQEIIQSFADDSRGNEVGSEEEGGGGVFERRYVGARGNGSEQGWNFADGDSFGV